MKSDRPEPKPEPEPGRRLARTVDRTVRNGLLHPVHWGEEGEVARIVFRMLDEMWYGRRGWGRRLAVLSLPYVAAVLARRALFRHGVRRSYRIGVPVVVVGNIAVGGTGKTPLVVWLAQRLRAHGYRPGVICSGYRGNAREWPRLVRADSDSAEVGDEAVLMAKRCACPVMAGPDRVVAAHSLLREAHCDVLVSDDGLQHYRLARDIEVAVLDGQRRHGTGWCFPAGPLREPVSRLESVDFVVAKGHARDGEYGMELSGRMLRQATDDSVSIDPAGLSSRSVHAVTGIGNPCPFFHRLRELGLEVSPRVFPDHHPFSAPDIEFQDDRPVVMTEKDAVKCRSFASGRHWYLPVEAVLDPAFETELFARLGECA